MDDLLSRLDAHLNSRGLEGFSNNGAKSLAHIVETLRGHEKESRVVQTAMAQIRKAIRPLCQKPALALVKATENRECEVNRDVLELLERCKGNPSAIFESQGPDTRIRAVHNLKELHQLGTHLLNRADDLRRHVFCIVISDAHDIVNRSKLSKTLTSTKTKRAIERLAACFRADGVDVPLSKLEENLREWVTCGAGHQQVMHSLGDGYLAVIPSDISIGILLKKHTRRAHHQKPSIEHLETWGVRRVAEESGANETIKAIRQFFQAFFRDRQIQANNISPQSATSSHGVGKSSPTNAPYAHSTVAAQEIPQSSASGEMPVMDGDEPGQGAEPTSWNGHSNPTPFRTKLLRSFGPSPWAVNEACNFDQSFSQNPPMIDPSTFDQSFSQNPPMIDSSTFDQSFSQNPPMMDPSTFEQSFSRDPSMIESFNQDFRLSFNHDPRAIGTYEFS